MTIASVILNQTESNTHVRGHLVIGFSLIKYQVSGDRILFDKVPGESK